MSLPLSITISFGVIIGLGCALTSTAYYRREKPTRKTKAAPRRLTLEDEMQEAGGSLAVQPIGVVRSIYRLCVGTPRQGLLAPHARGRIELASTLTSDVVDGLENYSHVWVVFVFHLNTKSKRGTPSKIAPPALGGKKIGTLATRSPHRFNPIGITLAKLVRIEQRRTTPGPGQKPKTQVILHIAGLDLVDGTPVLDIKPYVPDYDSPVGEECRLPSWVAGGLATKRKVTISEQAIQQLEKILQDDPLALDFYRQDELPSILATIEEVLAIDVRSQFQTKKARNGKSQAERAKRLEGVVAEESAPESCTQQIDNLLIGYTVEQSELVNRSTSEGSGAEDRVCVTSIQCCLKT
jgi:tRNA-Thr(GGU) m(6)t(6)A37 methyltransferase TsaA